METRKNLCAMLPVALHTRVRQEQEKAGMTLGEYVEAMITEYYDWKDGKIMTGEMRTLAAQIPAELFDRLDRYLKERGIKKKDFLVDIITRALEAAEAAELVDLTEGVTETPPNDGEEAVRLVIEKKPDLVLLDIMLPKMDGLTVCKKIRHNYNIPIIMLSAKDEEIDKILGLELGADDYITKPFSVRELIARVKANLRKSDNEYNKVVEEAKDNGRVPNEIKVGDLYLDLDKFEVKVRGQVIDLTLREFEVLKYLAQQPGQVVTRETLLEKVWGYEYYGDIRTVDVTVRRIREKIELDTSSPKILITKRSVGYYIAAK